MKFSTYQRAPFSIITGAILLKRSSTRITLAERTANSLSGFSLFGTSRFFSFLRKKNSVNFYSHKIRWGIDN